jgi:hypothetical protein
MPWSLTDLVNWRFGDLVIPVIKARAVARASQITKSPNHQITKSPNH